MGLRAWATLEVHVDAVRSIRSVADKSNHDSHNCSICDWSLFIKCLLEIGKERLRGFHGVEEKASKVWRFLGMQF